MPCVAATKHAVARAGALWTVAANAQRVPLVIIARSARDFGMARIAIASATARRATTMATAGKAGSACATAIELEALVQNALQASTVLRVKSAAARTRARAAGGATDKDCALVMRALPEISVNCVLTGITARCANLCVIIERHAMDMAAVIPTGSACAKSPLLAETAASALAATLAKTAI